jgi:drug/metabolite transporter (DMT)-like permease
MWKQSFFTCLGILPLLLWSTSTYASKAMLENWGSFFGAGIVFLISGALGLLILFFFEESKVVGRRNKVIKMDESDDHVIFSNSERSVGSGKAEKIRNQPKAPEEEEEVGFRFTQLTRETLLVYFFLISNLCLFLTSLGITPSTGDVLLHVIIVNYLWVILVNIGLVTVLNYTFTNRSLFYCGITLGFIGIIVSCIGFDFSHLNIGNYIVDYYYCYICALFSSLSWSGYTIYLKKYSHLLNDDHIFFSMIIAGMIMTLLSLLSSNFNQFGDISFSFIDLGFFIYCIFFANLLPYFLWDIGYKYGNAQMISNFSILTPFINVLSTSLFYGYDLFKGPIFGSIILIAAILCCRNGIVDPDLTVTSMNVNLSTKNNPSLSIKNSTIKETDDEKELEIDVESDRLPVTTIKYFIETSSSFRSPSSQKEGSSDETAVYGIEPSSSSKRYSTRMSQRTTIMIECPSSVVVNFSSKKAVVEPPPSLVFPISANFDEESQKPSTPLLYSDPSCQETAK